MKEKKCSHCGEVFQCGVDNQISTCWCTILPILNTIDAQQDCMCQLCLKEKLKQQAPVVD